MKNILTIAAVVGLMSLSASAADYDKYWPQWRGPDGTGVASHGNPPTEWSETKNVKWKKSIPGLAHASPIVWKDRVYVQTAAPGTGDKYKFSLMALDRKDGETVWEKVLVEEVPHERGHRDASQASASPVTDGKVIIAHFGSRGIFALDMDGKVLWNKDLGDMRTRRGFGEGSSATLVDETVVVNWDHEGDSFIVALDRMTGKEKWRKPRDEATSWSTPVIVEDGGKTLAVVNATTIRAYDVSNGEVVWHVGGMTQNAVPTPFFNDELLYVMTGFRGSALYGIKYHGAKGDLAGTDRIKFRYEQDTPYVPTGLLYGEQLYFLKRNNGMLSCISSETGSPFYPMERLPEIKGVYASMVGANGFVYVVGRNGSTVVLKKGPAFEVVSVNTLDDGFDASPAIVGGELYLRGREHLYCISE